MLAYLCYQTLQAAKNGDNDSAYLKRIGKYEPNSESRQIIVTIPLKDSAEILKVAK